MPDRPLIIFAGGGSAGHLSPALAIIEQLAPIAPEIDVAILAADRPVDRAVLEPTGIQWHAQSVRPFPARPTQWVGFLKTWYQSKRQARQLFERRRPLAVVGTGGFAAGPAVHVAAGMGIPVFLLNPDASVGRANRNLAPKADIIFTQWDATRDQFPRRLRSRVITTGCPVRSALLTATRDQGIAEFNLDPDLKTLLITGGSQGARTINNAMLKLQTTLNDHPDWQWLHITGRQDHDAVADAWSGHPRVRTVTFTNAMPAALAAADLVIARAGAVTLAELTAMRKPSILLPLPHDPKLHQAANAQVLADAHAAIALTDLKDPAANARQLAPTLANLMANPVRLQSMAESLAFAPQNAAATIADHLVALR